MKFALGSPSPRLAATSDMFTGPCAVVEGAKMIAVNCVSVTETVCAVIPGLEKVSQLCGVNPCPATFTV